MRNFLIKYGIAALFGVVGTYFYFDDWESWISLTDKLIVGFLVFGYDIMVLIMFKVKIKDFL